MIVDGRLIGGAADLREHLLACYPQVAIPPLDHVVGTATPMVARINHGMWIASCDCGAPKLPRPGCIVFLDRLVGWCVRCGNQASGHGWRPVVAPSPEDRARIEAVLLCRPNAEDRNWESGESVADLIAQNLDHGDPIPPPEWRTAAALPAVSRAAPWPTEAGRALLRSLRRKRWGR